MRVFHNRIDNTRLFILAWIIEYNDGYHLNKKLLVSRKFLYRFLTGS